MYFSFIYFLLLFMLSSTLDENKIWSTIHYTTYTPDPDPRLPVGLVRAHAFLSWGAVRLRSPWWSRPVTLLSSRLPAPTPIHRSPWAAEQIQDMASQVEPVAL